MTIKNAAEDFAKNVDDKVSGESTVDSDDAPPADDSSLETLIVQEQNLAHRRLREELGREPTQAEADEWLAAHTEGY